MLIICTMQLMVFLTKSSVMTHDACRLAVQAGSSGAVAAVRGGTCSFASSLRVLHTSHSTHLVRRPSILNSSAAAAATLQH